MGAYETGGSVANHEWIGVLVLVMLFGLAAFGAGCWAATGVKFEHGWRCAEACELHRAGEAE